jgi:hypothetical protein
MSKLRSHLTPERAYSWGLAKLAGLSRALSLHIDHLNECAEHSDDHASYKREKARIELMKLTCEQALDQFKEAFRVIP